MEIANGQVILRGVDGIVSVARNDLLQQMSRGETKVAPDEFSALPDSLRYSLTQYIAYFQAKKESVNVSSLTMTDPEHCVITVYHNEPSQQRKIFTRMRRGTTRWEIERVEAVAKP